MHTQVIPVHSGSYGQVLEHFKSGFVALIVVKEQHLFTEVVTFGAVARFMVPSQQVDVARVADLEAEEVCNNFGLGFATIDIVTQKQNLFARILGKARLLENI